MADHIQRGTPIMTTSCVGLAPKIPWEIDIHEKRIAPTRSRKSRSPVTLVGEQIAAGGEVW